MLWLCGFILRFIFVFFKQKTAYEMRISDWSSDVCSSDLLEEGIQWNFQTFPEYLSMIEQQGVGPNVAVYIGHSALRTYVMGADATTRAANDDEIDAMRGLVAEAMNVGALGFSKIGRAHV